MQFNPVTKFNVASQHTRGGSRAAPRGHWTTIARRLPAARRRLRQLALLVGLLCAVAFTSPLYATVRETLIELQDGGTVKVFIFEPDNHGDGPWPLSILMAGGGGNEYVARAQFWLGQELANQGWLIAVPVSPTANYFAGENDHRIPEVISQLQTHSSISGQKALLVGVSTGGSFALELAARQPELYYGVVAAPGMLKDLSIIKDMKQLPVYLRIGERDSFRWDRSMPALVQALEEAGAQVNARLVPRGQHIFRMNWDNLRPWLDSLRHEHSDR